MHIKALEEINTTVEVRYKVELIQSVERYTHLGIEFNSCLDIVS
jgi:hypothetical protein